MESGQKSINWRDGDMSKLISLYSVSSRAYCYLKDVCQIYTKYTDNY